jgi:hypothetical protein
VLSLVAVVALLLFLAWRSRRNPLFLAGAAVYLALGPSIYIDLFPGHSVLGSTLPVTTGDLLFAAVALGWLYARTKRPVPRVRLSAAWTVIGILVSCFLVLELALAWASATELHPQLILATRDWFFIPVAFLMTLDVLRRFTAEEIAQYVGVLSLFTACVMVLYIASALNIPVYPYAKNFTAVIDGGIVSREFTAFPLWAGLAWCHYLSQPRKNVWTYAGMALLTCGVIFSFTRSMIGLLVVTAMLAVVLLMFRRGRRTHALVVFATCAALAVVVLLAGPVVAPRQFGFLKERFGRGSVSADPNAVFRVEAFDQAHAAGARADRYLGAGLFDSAPSVNGGQYLSSDSDWIGIVYRTGWVGIIVLAVPLAVAIWRGTRSFVRGGSSGTAATLLLTGVLATVWYVGVRFVSPVYLWWPSVSLFSVALVAYASGVPGVGPAVSTGAVESRTNGPGELSRGL